MLRPYSHFRLDFLPTIRADTIMQRNHPAALGARPSCFFRCQKRLFANGLEPVGIINQADVVSLLITFVQPFDFGAGEGITIAAKNNLMAGRAVLDVTLAAVFRFTGILSPASLAGLLFA